MTRPRPSSPPQGEPSRREWFSELIGRTRFVVLIAVIAVLLVAFSLFLQGTILALNTIYQTWREMFTQGIDSQSGTLAVEFLEVVGTMLKAVVFYLIGVGLYSLFIKPLNLTSALGVESLSDLEQKVVSVVIVILGVTFLEHFIRWEEPVETLYFAGSLALAGGALVLFQQVHKGSGSDLQQPGSKLKARRDLFERDSEQRHIDEEDVEIAKQATEAKAEGKVPAGGGSE
ncbi:YqhA family protein [Deinococcus sp. MIMF12]|uniref:YqhA family protein n=1 Tax=Deinococcus rhizophilus TaxID=3049544 RepID=A0ABT7JEQ8_9DEIO|nr:YqhA family protein [Deinococcus rhizophilus]MDL2343531.1 YqhA family protein [Deinococcus rhizophilus]